MCAVKDPEAAPLMIVVRGHHDVPTAARGAVLAIGNFDGVHRGHQALLAKARSLAGATGAPSGVLTFEPHPRRHFQPDTPLFQLTPLDMKLDLLARYGCEVSVVLAFDQALANLTAEAFIRNVLVAALGVRHIIVGYDFMFGKGRTGSPATLRAATSASTFAVTVLDPVSVGSEVASSSAARTALSAGAVDHAAGILGHWWRVAGTVTGGAKRGTGMGYPTANITLPPGIALAHGIYAARVYVDGTAHAGAAYLGTRPTFDNGRPVLETFLLDFDDNLYGRSITIELISRLRADRSFANTEALIAQMDLDVAETRQRLSALEVHDPFAWPAL